MKEANLDNILLQLSSKMIAIRDQEALFQFIFTTLKAQLRLDDVVLNVWQETEDHQLLLSSYSPEWSSFESLINQKTAQEAHVYQEAWLSASKKPLILDLTDPKTHRLDLYSTRVAQELEYKENYLIVLKLQQERVGILELFSNEMSHLKTIAPKALDLLIQFLPICISNILDHEAILIKQKEKEILLSISEKVAEVRNWKALFVQIFEVIKPLFQFEDAVITLLLEPSSREAQKLRIFINESKYENNPNYEKIANQHFNQPPHFKKIFSLKKPHLFTIEEYDELSPEFVGVQLMKDVGLKATWVGRLVHGAALIGALEFHYPSKAKALKVDLSLFENVLNQLSIAVANILANEKVLEEKVQKETLLAISEDVTSIRDINDLAQVIFNRMQSVFQFDDALVNVWSSDGSQFRMLFSDHSAKTNKQEEYAYFLSGFHLKKNTPYELIYEKDEPSFYTLDYWLDKYPDFPGIQLINKMAYIEHVVLPLWQGNKKIGVLEFHSKVEGKLKNQNTELFKGAADQIAVAVSNILANEEILEQQKEKELLLSFSEDISKERDQEGLISIINQKMKSIFRFDYSVIVIQSKDGIYQTHWFVELDEKLEKNDHLEKIKELTLPIVDTPLEWILKFTSPSFFIAEDLNTHPDFPGTRLYWEMGMQKSVVLPLQQGNEQIGVMMFHYALPEVADMINLSLAENTANQIAVAVSNILANEEILERQKEKEILLSVSKDIALVRNKEELWNLISTKLQPLFNFQDSVVVKAVGKTHHQHILVYAADDVKEFHTYKNVVDGIHPNKGTTWDYQMSLTEPKILLLEDLMEMEEGDHHPGYIMMKAIGRVESFGAPLSFAGEKFGFLWFHYLENRLPREKLFLFGQVADQIAAAVSNILANEEILERQKEKEILLSLSDDIANIRDRHDLYQVMMGKIKMLIDFDDAIILVKNRLGTHYNLFLNLADEERQAHPLFNEVVNTDTVIEGTPIELFFQQGNLFKWQAKEIIKEYPDFAGMILQIETGLHYSFNLLLKSGNNIRGLLVFHFKVPFNIDENKSELYKGIGDQFSVAVSNILANEEILKKQQEKETLLAISEAMTTIRDREDLFRVMMKHIAPILNFRDAVATRLNKKQTAFKTFLTVSPDSRKKHPKYQDAVDKWIAVEGSEVEYALKKDDVFEWKTDEMLSLYPDSPGLQLMKDTGLSNSISIKLYYAGSIIGFVFFHFDHDPQFEIGLLKNISEQLAIAISNVLANEEILDRQREKEILLAISEQVAQARNWNELFGTVLEKLRPIFGFADAVITYPASDSYERLRILTAENELSSTHSKYYYDIMGHEFEIQPHFKEIYTSKEPKFYTIDDYERLSGTFRGIGLMKEMGLVATWASALILGNRVIGSLEMHFKSKEEAAVVNKNMFKNVLNQLSVAVSNILANEEILERQKEKESLLSISEGIARVKNRQDLYQLITEEVKPHISFDAIVLVTIDHKEKVYQVFLDQTDAQNTTNPIYRRLMATLVSTEDPATKAIFNKKDFRLISVDEEIKRFPDFIGHHLMKENGFNYSYKFNLKSSGKTYGVGAFHFRKLFKIDERSIPFLSNVISQISVAVSNIISNEEIVYREKIKTLQAFIAQAITSRENWAERFEAIMVAMKGTFPFDYISLAIDTEGDYAQGCAFERIGHDEYRLMKAEQFFERSGMSLEDYTKARQEMPYFTPEIWNGEEFKKILEKDKIKKALAKLFRLQSNLNIPLNLSRKGQFQISLYSRMEHTYTNQHLEFIEQLLPALIHPLEKVVAFDQIEKLNTLLKQEKEYLQEEIKVNYNFEEIIGSSKALHSVFEKISQVAIANTTVLITGETGTGKELVARALHNLSGREQKPLVKVNCSTLPTELLESELFGHEKGAFTGAVKQRIGKFELAHSGTIFLDEIGEIPINLQSKLLRVIQEKEFERLGGNRTIQVDTRIIAATNRNLEEEVAKGNFRSDLFFRLNVFPIHLPPLRDRKEDIPALTLHFLQKSCKKIGKKISGISNSSFKQLMGYDWPGNIRELEHLVERAVLINNSQKLNITIDKKGLGVQDEGSDTLPFRPQTMADAERTFILNTLRYCGGKIRGKGGAAELLGMPPSTLDSRIKKLGIEKKHIFKGKPKD